MSKLILTLLCALNLTACSTEPTQTTPPPRSEAQARAFFAELMQAINQKQTDQVITLICGDKPTEGLGEEEKLFRTVQVQKALSRSQPREYILQEVTQHEDHTDMHIKYTSTTTQAEDIIPLQHAPSQANPNYCLILK